MEHSKAIPVEDLTDEMIAAIAASTMDPAYNHLNAELDVFHVVRADNMLMTVEGHWTVLPTEAGKWMLPEAIKISDQLSYPVHFRKV